MLRIIAESVDNYVARKFELALENRHYYTSPEKMVKLKTLITLPKEELFLQNTPISTKELTTGLKFFTETEKFTVYQFIFTSPYLTHEKENNLVYGKFYQSKSAPDGPVVVVLPGWMTYKEENYYSEPLGKMFLEAGINYIFYSLPYHLERTPRGKWSGELAISGDLYRTVEAFRQAIIEVRTILVWLKNEVQPKKVGVMGLSLGGWLVSHLLHLEDRLDFAILMIPAINPTLGLWQTKIAKPIREDLKKFGLNEEIYHQLFYPFDPVNYESLLNPEKVLIVRALYDLCVPSSALDRYCEHMHNVKLQVYRQSHFSILHSKKPIEGIIRFIRN